MPTRIHIENRYCSDDPIGGATVTVDDDPITPQTKPTAPNGWGEVATEKLSDGRHVLRVRPAYTTDAAFSPDLAEDLPAGTKRLFRPLDIDITISKGRITTISAPLAQREFGSVGPGTNPINVYLQPLFFRGTGQRAKTRDYDSLSLIVIHQTAGGGKVHGTLSTFTSGAGSPGYLVTHDTPPQVIKIVQDKYTAGHIAPAANQSSWAGKQDVDVFSIGIENNHKAGTPWPRAQIDRLIRHLEQLLKAYPSIPRHRIVGHSDVYLFHRDCPGLEFDWYLLEREGLGMIPKLGGVEAALQTAYGGFFRLKPDGKLKSGDNNTKRVFGGKTWEAISTPGTQAPPSPVTTLPTTVVGDPIRELQTDLRAIGYSVNLTGIFDAATLFAVEVFQKHFFSGIRRSMVDEKARGLVDIVTAEYIKAVRP